MKSLNFNIGSGVCCVCCGFGRFTGQYDVCRIVGGTINVLCSGHTIIASAGVQQTTLLARFNPTLNG